MHTLMIGGHNNMEENWYDDFEPEGSETWVT